MRPILGERLLMFRLVQRRVTYRKAQPAECSCELTGILARQLASEAPTSLERLPSTRCDIGLSCFGLVITAEQGRGIKATEDDLDRKTYGTSVMQVQIEGGCQYDRSGFGFLPWFWNRNQEFIG